MSISIMSVPSQEHTRCVKDTIMLEQEQCLDLLCLFKLGDLLGSFSVHLMWCFQILLPVHMRGVGGNQTDHTGGPFVLCLRSLFLDLDGWLDGVMEDLWVLMRMLNILTPRNTVSHRKFPESLPFPSF